MPKTPNSLIAGSCWRRMRKIAVYANEEEMYPSAANWLKSYLSQAAKGQQVRVLQSHRERLSRLIRSQLDDIQQYLPPEWQSWDVQVDIVGFIVGKDKKMVKLAVVECKLTRVNLSHLSQLIGYARVVNPDWAFLLSPQGIHQRLRHLLTDFNRQDILAYGDSSSGSLKQVIIARWLHREGTVDWSTVIPQGASAIRHL